MIYNTSRFRSNREAWGPNIMFTATFSTDADEVVTVKTSISAISTDGAALNMRELDGMTFDSVKALAEQKWEKELSTYTIKGTREQKETFYTSAYHAALCPFVYNDGRRLLSRTRQERRERERVHKPHRVLVLGHVQGIPSADESCASGHSGGCGKLHACTL